MQDTEESSNTSKVTPQAIPQEDAGKVDQGSGAVETGGENATPDACKVDEGIMRLLKEGEGWVAIHYTDPTDKAEILQPEDFVKDFNNRKVAHNGKYHQGCRTAI